MSPVVRRVPSSSPEATFDIGARLGRVLEPGAFLDLRGELGAGKTQLVRGIASGLGISTGVRSPTFTICQVHCGRGVLYHLDVYRLEDPEELLIQGWDEMRDTGVVVVEWGDRLGELLPAERLMIEIEAVSPTDRELVLSAFGDPAVLVLEGCFAAP